MVLRIVVYVRQVSRIYKATETEQNNSFGVSVALDIYGKTLAIGTYQVCLNVEENESDAVYFY
jgi:hypothetical protein